MVVSRHDTSAWWDVVHRDWWSDHLTSSTSAWCGARRCAARAPAHALHQRHVHLLLRDRRRRGLARFRQDEISNNHLLANDPAIVKRLRGVRPGRPDPRARRARRVRPRAGRLRPRHQHPRDDQGNGACETIWVTEASVLRRANTAGAPRCRSPRRPAAGRSCCGSCCLRGRWSDAARSRPPRCRRFSRGNVRAGSAVCPPDGDPLYSPLRRRPPQSSHDGTPSSSVVEQRIEKSACRCSIPPLPPTIPARRSLPPAIRRAATVHSHHEVRLVHPMPETIAPMKSRAPAAAPAGWSVVITCSGAGRGRAAVVGDERAGARFAWMRETTRSGRVAFGGAALVRGGLVVAERQKGVPAGRSSVRLWTRVVLDRGAAGAHGLHAPDAPAGRSPDRRARARSR